MGSHKSTQRSGSAGEAPPNSSTSKEQTQTDSLRHESHPQSTSSKSKSKSHSHSASAMEQSKDAEKTLSARESGVLRLTAMGFDEAAAKDALIHAKNDKENAVHALLDGAADSQGSHEAEVKRESPLENTAGEVREPVSNVSEDGELVKKEPVREEFSIEQNSDGIKKGPVQDSEKEPVREERGEVEISSITQRSSDEKEMLVEHAKEPVSGFNKEPAREEAQLRQKEPVGIISRTNVPTGSREILPLSVVFMEKLHKVFHHKQVKYLKSYGYSRHEAVEALKAQENGSDVNQALLWLMERGLPDEIKFKPRQAYDQRLLRLVEGAGQTSSEQMDYSKCQLKRRESLVLCKDMQKGGALPPSPKGVYKGPPLRKPSVRSNEALLQKRLFRLGLVERRILGDGNCQYRALSQELYGNEGHYKQIRYLTVQHMRMHESEYLPLFSSPTELKGYLKQMKMDKVWGDELTLRACADALNVAIHVLTSTPGNTGYYLIYMPRKLQPFRHCFLTYHCPFHYDVFEERIELDRTPSPKAQPLSTENAHAAAEELTAMGFERDQALTAMTACDNDPEVALDSLVVAKEVALVEAEESKEHAIARQLSGVRKLGEMGFSESQAALALVDAKNDKEKAVQALLEMDTKGERAKA